MAKKNPTTEAPEATDLTVETVAAEEPAKVDGVVDVDKTWDGDGSLDDHRQAAFKNLDEQGFGNKPATAESE